MSKKRFLVILVLVFGIGLIVLANNVKAITHGFGVGCAGENQPCGIFPSCCGTLSCVPNEGQLFVGTCKLTQSSLQEPLNNGGLHVKIDIKENELFAFRFVDGSNCLIKLEEEDDYSGDEKRDVNGDAGGIIIHKSGSLSMAAPNAYCPNRPGDDECEVFRKNWDDNMNSKCGDCSLAQSNTIYRPKVDLLCADGKWYLCSREYHAGQNRLFKKGNNAFICTKDNEWKKATEICDNGEDDDGDGKADCDDSDCANAPNCQPASNEQACNNIGGSFDVSASSNKCCGDEQTDCGAISSSNKLCTKGTDGKWSWVEVAKGSIRHLGCSDVEYVSDGTNWVKCDKTFQDDNKNIKNIDEKDYFCTGKGEDSIVVCCGDNQECKSKTDGKRIATGQSIKAAIQTQDSGNPTQGTASVVYDVSSITGRVVETFCPQPVLTASPSQGEIPLEVVLAADATDFIDCVKDTYLTPDWDYTLQWTFKFDDFDANGLGGDYEVNYYATHLTAGHKIQQSSHKYEKRGLHNPSVEVEVQPEAEEFRSATASTQVNIVATSQECGNGVVDVDKGEECDGSKFKNDVATCASYDSNRFKGGDLACTNDCKISTANCVLKTCGDGDLDADERCDGSLFRENKNKCTDYKDASGNSFTGGTLSCKDCNIDATQCTKAQFSQPEGEKATFYCRSDFKFVTDLDAPSDKASENEKTCKAAGFVWTGTKCCSEDDDNLTKSTLREFYNDPDGAGGCWNSTFIRSVDYAHNYSVISYDGLFYGCAININNEQFGRRFGIKFRNFDKRNDGFPELTDKFSQEKLITEEEHCANKEIKNQNGNVIGFYYCAYAETWNYSLSKKDTLSIVPITIANVKLQAGCCGDGACWNGSACLENQTGKPTQPPHIKTQDENYRCIDGVWNTSITKKSPDGSDGYCPKETQCLYKPDSTNVAEQCIESGEYKEDNFCEDGKWTSRTKLIASKLLELVGANDFTLFCDNKENTLNYLAYRISNKEITMILNEDLKANNFCVLNTNNKAMLATSLNEDISQKLGNLLPILGINAQTCTRQDALNDDGNYHACDNNNRLLVNKKLNSFAYSISVPSARQSVIVRFEDFVLAPFKIVIDKVRSFVRNDNAFMLLENTPRFERLYASKNRNKIIIGTLQGTDYKTAVLEYRGFGTDICSLISQFYAVQIRDEESGISCRKEGNNYYVIAQGSESVNFNPENIWLDLTSKLRVS